MWRKNKHIFIVFMSIINSLCSIYCTPFYSHWTFRSEVTSVLKIRYTEELRKLHLKLKFNLGKEYSVFLRKFMLQNYVIISLPCVTYERW